MHSHTSAIKTGTLKEVSLCTVHLFVWWSLCDQERKAVPLDVAGYINHPFEICRGLHLLLGGVRSQQQVCTVLLPPSLHIRWVYCKDSKMRGGGRKGWVALVVTFPWSHCCNSKKQDFSCVYWSYIVCRNLTLPMVHICRTIAALWY